MSRTRSARSPLLPLTAVALAAVTALAAFSSCDDQRPPVPQPTAPVAAPTGPTPTDARTFLTQLDADLRRLNVAQSLAQWERATNITPETEAVAAKADLAAMEYLARAIQDARRFEPIADELDATTRRELMLLRIAGQPAPADPANAAALAAVQNEMAGLYGKGKACDAKGKCRTLGDLEDVLSTNRDPKQLRAAWEGWHKVARGIEPLYAKFVTLANEGAREAGFADVGDMWRTGYDMTPAALETEVERLWTQVAPLYEQLHCYTRRKLSKRYGTKVVPDGQPIPAHLLGNMWSQAWSNIYPELAPFPKKTSPDATPALAKQNDPLKMVRLAESFFTSLGLDPLPKTFWEHSLFTKPEGREVECHASAWDPTYADDLRIKMCIKPNQEDLITIHHELGHDYYFHYYYKLPMLFQAGAHDGFHEAIGDAIALSVTPSYLAKAGLLAAAPSDAESELGQLMFVALDKIAFLPFGLLVDKWRWDVFSGKVAPEAWNAHWWELRRKYQGIAPPSARTEDDFDPGAKYHVPSNTSYLRYFLATVLQFQFHRSMCRAALHEGPLHTCSVFGSKAAGDRLRTMLAMGSSKPWPEAMEAMTGQKEMDASALVEYFAPLSAWLEQQNAGQKCGW